jgi:hypothetical protein
MMEHQQRLHSTRLDLKFGSQTFGFKISLCGSIMLVCTSTIKNASRSRMVMMHHDHSQTDEFIFDARGGFRINRIKKWHPVGYTEKNTAAKVIGAILAYS